MILIVGLVVVVAAVIGGYLMAGGALMVLVQPSEFVVIGGAALGSMLVSTPKSVLLNIIAQVKGAMGTGTVKEDYVDLLALLYLVFKQVQQGGVMSLEPHFEDPANSPLLTRYPKFLPLHEAVDFLADSV